MPGSKIERFLALNDNMTEDNHAIQLVVQYYRCHDHDRQKEIDTCLCMNLKNPIISKVHLLTEELFDLSSYPCHEKIIQTVIDERLTYEYAFKYVNKVDPLSKCIWILSNADIYFDETLRFVEWANLDRVVYALTRYDVQDDGSLRSIPSALAHGCQDVWIFRAPVLVNKMFSSFCLGIAGCDHRIAYEFTETCCAVANPSLTITAYHLDLSRHKDIHTKTKEYAGLMTEGGYRLDKVVPPPYLYCIYPSAQLAYPDVALLKRHVLSESKAFQRENELLGLIDDERCRAKALIDEERCRAKAEKDYLLYEQSLLKEEQAEYIRTIHDMSRHLQTKDQRIAAYEHSLSWRVTAPLRRLGEFFSVAAVSPPLPVSVSSDMIDLDLMADLVAAQKKAGCTMLVMDFNLGGGSNLYSRNLVARLERFGHKVILLEYRYGLKDYHLEFHTGTYIAEHAFTSFSDEYFATVVARLAVDKIVVNQLVTWPETVSVLAAIRATGRPYLVFAHDYFLVCPNWTLFDYREKYCGIPDDPEICAECLSGLRGLDVPIEQHTVAKRIEPWRMSAEEFLESAEKVICFSGASLGIIKKAYPTLTNTVIQEHSIPDQHLFIWRQRDYHRGEMLTIAITGGINIPKGSRIVGQLLDDKRLQALPVRFVIIGNINPLPVAGPGRDRHILHGGYTRQQLAGLLDEYNASVVLIPSLCPETFCFSASEALLLGVPVLCCNIGAQADRVRIHDAGWVVDEPYLDGLVAVIQGIAASPQTVREKSIKCREYQPASMETHYLAISNLLNPLT